MCKVSKNSTVSECSLLCSLVNISEILVQAEFVVPMICVSVTNYQNPNYLCMTSTSCVTTVTFQRDAVYCVGEDVRGSVTSCRGNRWRPTTHTNTLTGDVLTKILHEEVQTYCLLNLPFPSELIM